MNKQHQEEQQDASADLRPHTEPARPEPKPIACPYCGSPIEARLEYTGWAHSEHRDLTGYECESYECWAEWDAQGKPTKVPTGPHVDDVLVVNRPLPL